MKKLLAVLKREYLQTVRKKMFIIMTFLMPVLIAAVLVLPSLIMARGMGEKKIAVVDGTGKLREAFTKAPALTETQPEPARRPGRRRLPENMRVEYVDAAGKDADEIAKPFLTRMSGAKETRIDGVFVVPADAITNTDATLKYYSRAAADFMSQERLSSIANGAIQRDRLAGRGLSADDVDNVLRTLSVDAVQLSKSGEEKKGGIANFFVGFMMTGLLLIPSFMYGLEIMRGIIQEKTDRVVEVLVSSMSTQQLLIGKILGVALVGLTQIGVWFIMFGAVGAFGIATAAMAGENVLQLLRPSTFVYFFIFFVLAYLTYVCIYAIGGAVSNSEKEAQQLIAPITMIMMLPWFLLVAIITNPDSTLSVAFSLSPVFGPMTMYVRILVAEPPMWHIALTILISIATIAVFFWATAKIFRVGILSYGKRPTVPELWRWIKVA
ncbi:MAG TPA: ABC transporter permease [Thermoanaerobaculia bacterium]|nr:ABC transporter permease [Thermoanaerobaculia bacterium]